MADRKIRLSPRQLELLQYMRDTRMFLSESVAGGYHWPQSAPTPRPMADARVINPLIHRGILKYIGDGDWDWDVSSLTGARS
jgi:hypothetical protein